MQHPFQEPAGRLRQVVLSAIVLLVAAVATRAGGRVSDVIAISFAVSAGILLLIIARGFSRRRR